MQIASLVSPQIRSDLVAVAKAYQSSCSQGDEETFARAAAFFSFALDGYDRYVELHKRSLISKESLAVLRACSEVECYYANLGDYNHFQAYARSRRTKQQASNARWYGFINSAVSNHRELFTKIRLYELVNLLDSGKVSPCNEPVFRLPTTSVSPLGASFGRVDTLALIGESPIYVEGIHSPSLAVKLGLVPEDQMLFQGVDCAKPLTSPAARAEYEQKRAIYAR